jgi:hypothetical protein
LPAYAQRTQRHDDNNHDETIWRRGELLAEMDKNKGAREQGVGRRGKNAVASSNRVSKLFDLGVSQTQAGELLAEMKTRGERREHSQRSPRATSENLPPKLSDLGNSLRLKTGDRACSARQRPLYHLHASGIAAGSDDAEGGARLFERLRIDVGLGGRLGVILLNAQMSGFGDGNLVLDQSTTGFGPGAIIRRLFDLPIGLSTDRAMEAWYNSSIA